MWHASVALVGKRATIPAALVAPAPKRLILAVVKGLLAGVGQLPSVLDQHELAFHYRRAITDEEWAALPASWCAIPAVHEAGLGVILERDT